ncbi:hypothetical protein [Croceicoccus bisphenolivorans]|uniref:hypothetical protein n=1 Tax=Croceicoccus bisphenolivorans TaxID=1783232 RepID=UPI000835EB88|nr:hypothetical protein [Croceicoccus bisphenolivorans]
MERHGDQVDVTTTEARAGSTPHIVRYVLLISLFLAAAAMTVVWVTGAATADDPAPSGAELTSNPPANAATGTEAGAE